MIRLIPDFETRSPADLKKVGAYIYSLHPHTSVLCLGWTFDDRATPDPEVHIWHPAFPAAGLPERGADALLELHERVIFGEIVEAHNVMFERSIWQNICAPRLGWPALEPGQLRCTAARAASFSLPRNLEQACEVLDLPVRKDMVGNRLMRKLSKPRKPTVRELRAVGLAKGDDAEFTRRHGYLWHEKPEELQRVFEYNVGDVRAQLALSRALRDMSDDELEVWRVDQEMNWRGLAVDVPGVRKAVALVDEAKRRADAEIADITGGAVPNARARVAFKDWSHAVGQPLPNTQANTIEEWLKQPGLSSTFRRVLDLWRSANRSSTAKYKAILSRVAPDGRIRDNFRYWGASTGRWAGMGVQIQNLKRGFGASKMDEAWADIHELDYDTILMLRDDVMEFLSSATRGAFVATPGCNLSISDFSSIEARVLFWLAGAIRALQVLHAGQSIYKDMAGAILSFMGTPVADPQAIPKGTDEYQLGKQAILGLGYQMGGPKFVVTCEGYGIVVSLDFGKQVVNIYRTTYPEVPALWRMMEAAAIDATQRGDGAPAVHVGPIRWAVRGRFLHARLPSGRLLSYCDPVVISSETPWGEPAPKLVYMGVDSYSRKWKLQKTYGGKLVENVVQAISRDLMSDAMIRSRDLGYPPVLTVHDEVGLEVPATDDFDLESFNALMCQLPAWAEGLPIDAEGGSGWRYRKW